MNFLCKTSLLLALLFSTTSASAEPKSKDKKPLIMANISVKGKTKGVQKETVTEEEVLDFLSMVMKGVSQESLDALKKEKQWPKLKQQMLRPMIMDKVMKIMGMDSDVKNNEDVKKKVLEATKNIIADEYKKVRVEHFSNIVSKDKAVMRKIKSEVQKMGPLYTISLIMTSSSEATRIKSKIESAAANSQPAEWLKLTQHLKLSPQETSLPASELRQILEQRKMTDVTIKVGAVIVVTPDTTKDKSMVLFVKEKNAFEDGGSRFDEMVKNKVTSKANEMFIKDMAQSIECTDENGKKIDLESTKDDSEAETESGESSEK